MQIFYQVALPGSLSDCSLETHTFKQGFPAFMHLICTAYFTKHASAFMETTPQSNYNAFSVSESEGHAPVKAQHMKWLENIRKTVCHIERCGETLCSQ